LSNYKSHTVPTLIPIRIKPPLLDKPSPKPALRRSWQEKSQMSKMKAHLEPLKFPREGNLQKDSTLRSNQVTTNNTLLTLFGKCLKQFCISVTMSRPLELQFRTILYEEFKSKDIPTSISESLKAPFNNFLLLLSTESSSDDKIFSEWIQTEEMAASTFKSAKTLKSKIQAMSILIACSYAVGLKSNLLEGKLRAQSALRKFYRDLVVSQVFFGVLGEMKGNARGGSAKDVRAGRGLGNGEEDELAFGQEREGCVTLPGFNFEENWPRPSKHSEVKSWRASDHEVMTERSIEDVTIRNLVMIYLISNFVYLLLPFDKVLNSDHPKLYLQEGVYWAPKIRIDKRSYEHQWDAMYLPFIKGN